MGGYISYIPLVIIFASQGVWLSQVNQRLGLAFLQQLPSGRRPDGVLPWAWRKNSSLPLKAWCLKRFSWACFTLKWRVKHKAWKKTRWKQGWITLTFIYNHNYMYIYMFVLSCPVAARAFSSGNPSWVEGRPSSISSAESLTNRMAVYSGYLEWH